MTTVDAVRLTNVAFRLRRKRKFKTIVRLLNGAPAQWIDQHIEIPLMLATALSYLRRHSEAKSVLLRSSKLALSENPSINRRWKLLMGIQLLEEGSLRDAEVLLISCLESAERASDARIIADTNNSMGVVESFRGNVERAIIHFQRSLLAWEQLGETQGVAIANYNVALVYREWGHPIKATPHFEAAEHYFSVAGIQEERVYVLAERALLYRDLGDVELAERMARTALKNCEPTFAPAVRATALRSLGSVLMVAGSVAEAERCLKAARRELINTSAGLILAEVLEELSILEAQLGRERPANRFLQLASKEYLRIGSVNHAERLVRRYESIK